MTRGGVPTALCLVLDELDEGQTGLTWEVTAAALALEDADYVFPATVRVALSVGRAAEMFTLVGTASTRVHGECCRCLAAAEAALEAPLRLLLQRKVATGDELAAVAEEDEVELVPPGTRQFDLTEMVRQALVLELPVRLYCRADCRGLCPRCGQDLNQGECRCAHVAGDPRWGKLAGVTFT
jgi:uncharacterized metal-binding protein YceD (DUF177 family)